MYKRNNKGQFIKGFSNPNKKPKVKLICKQCRKEYERYSCKVKESKFCNHSCRAKWMYENKIKKYFLYERSGSKNPFWKGGRWKNKAGYILVFVPNHPNPNHGKGSYVFEHRYIMEQSIGRYLKQEERVHHINGTKDDNRIENLELFLKQGDHIKLHIREKTINNNYWLGKKFSKEHIKNMSKPKRRRHA